MTGPPGRPLRAGASVIDIMGAMFGVIAVQAALRERDATGQGPARVERAVRERRVSDEHAHGRDGGDRARGAADADPARRLGDLRGVRHAGGGQLFIGVTSDQQWARFVEEFGLQELAADPRLATNVMRLAERSWLIPALQEVIGKIPRDEVASRVRARAGVVGAGRPAGRSVRRPASAGDRRSGRGDPVALWRRGRQAGAPAGTCRSSSAPTGSAPVSCASRRGSASTMPRSSPKPGFRRDEIAELAESGVITR